MSNVLVHGLQTKRIQKLGAVNFIFLVGAPVVTIFAVGAGHSPWYLFLVALVVPGIPIKDYGHPFAWLAQHVQAEQVWNRSGGITEAPAVLRNAKPKKQTAPAITWQDTSTVLVAHIDQNNNVIQVPFLLNNGFLTGLILDTGVAEEVLEESVGERFYDDLSLVRESVLALCKTRQPELLFGTAYLKTKADQTRGFEFTRRRGNADMVAAMGATEPTDRFDEVDMMVAHHAVEVHDNGYHGASQAYNLTFVRMPLPMTRLGRPVDLTNPQKMRKTDIIRTVIAVMQAYAAVGIQSHLLNETELNNLLLTGLNLRELTTVFTQQQRDRELIKRRLVKEPGDVPGAKRNAWRPRTTSFDFDKEQALGYMVIDGTYVAAGHVDKLSRESQPGGFMSQLLRVPSDISFGFVTIVDAPFVGIEKVKAKEKERWTKVAQGLFSFNNNLSTPEQDIAVRDVVEFRRRLAESSNRAGNFTNILVVMSNSVENVRSDWDDVVSVLARAYQFEQVHLPSQIMNWTKALFGIFPK